MLVFEGYEELIFPLKKRMQKDIILSLYVIRYETNTYSSVIYKWEKKVLEISEITSEYEVGLGLSEIGQFEVCHVLKHFFLA